MKAHRSSTNETFRAWFAPSCIVLSILSGSAQAAEVGYLEDFAIAADRAVALEQLIPGTDEYFYFHCLHAQNENRLEEVDRILERWRGKHRRSPRMTEIENRQAILLYPTEPARSIQYLRDKLGLKFNHERQAQRQESRLPSRLSDNLIDRETLVAKVLRRRDRSMKDLEPRFLSWAIGLRLHPDQRRQVLSALLRPDVENLPGHVIDDLNHKDSGGFGSLGIHSALLLDQLDTCLELKPNLRNEQRFVHTYLSKLRPAPGEDWRHDAVVREAYLERLWAFASTLNASHNSLKAHILYHRLVHDRQGGNYDRSRLLEYLALPRRTHYANPKYYKRESLRRHTVDLNADFRSVTNFDRIHDDTALVNSYLQHFFQQDDSYSDFAVYVNDIYLKHVFAETKILYGLGDMERWYGMLPPPRLQEIRDRVEIDFTPTNKTVFAPDEQVSLDVDVKNVRTLLVKVFELNTLGYYRAQSREIDTAIDLDGLVANSEKTYTFDVPSLRRARRHFEFPDLRRRGTFVVELIGNGKSSRALVRKGKLSYLEHPGEAGHVFSVLDENNRRLLNAHIELAGHVYKPDEQGYIDVPFSTKPAKQTIILVHEGRASLDEFEHAAEKYDLSVGFFVQRESLIRNRKAQVVLRPTLTINGVPMSLERLEGLRLTIASLDREGTPSSSVVENLKLHDHQESTHEFLVPPRLSQLTFTLTAELKSVSEGKKVPLAATSTVSINAIDATDKIEDLHFSQQGGEFFLEALGKNGERRGGRHVALRLKHRGFRSPVETRLESDEDGRVALGRLEEIDWVQATGPNGQPHTWQIPRDQHDYPATLHALAGTVLRVPYMGAADETDRRTFSLLESRAGVLVRDHFDALSLSDGYLELRELPAGEYLLALHEEGVQILVRVGAGTITDGYVVSPSRQLESRPNLAVQLGPVEFTEEAVRIPVHNASGFTRVHVVGTRFIPSPTLYQQLAPVARRGPRLIDPAAVESLYVVGRDIGDEYRYVLERKSARRFPGNMLVEPSLLLNPWSLRTADTERQEARKGGEYASKSAAKNKRASGRERLQRAGEEQAQGYANLDFLAGVDTVRFNLKPAEGVISVPREVFESCQQVYVLAVDPTGTAFRSAPLPRSEDSLRDLRLAASLPADKRFTEKSVVSIVGENSEFAVEDVATAQFEVFDSLASVFALFETLSKNANLNEFRFILDWPILDDAEKRAKYSEYASHELNFFLYKKDPEFFQEIVRPYLANKLEKTFLDAWLLDAPLESFLDAWSYGQLNVVERVLLADRLEGESVHTARHLDDLLELIPVDSRREASLFDVALKRDSLSVGGGAWGGRRVVDAGDEAGAASTLSFDFAADAAPEAPALAAPQSAESRGRRRFKAENKESALELAERDLEEALEQEVLREELRSRGTFARKSRSLSKLGRLYRALDTTREWLETQYYKVPLEEQNSSLVTVNAFWNDYAHHDDAKPFYSRHLASAARTFTEMMLALAVLDLPFQAEKPETEVDGERLVLKARTPLIVFHKEIKEAAQATDGSAILASQNFYRHGGRHRTVNGEQIDNFVSGEFLVQTVYGAHLVLTNPTSARQKLDLLLQIPAGSIPVAGTLPTRSLRVELEPYRTWTYDYFFYFPRPGEYTHYPMHVARNEESIATTSPVTFVVRLEPTNFDRSTWEFISQNGTDEEVLTYLRNNNSRQIPLNQIAWRLRDKEFFGHVVERLGQRHHFDSTIWSYGFYHSSPDPMREYLRHSDGFLSQCGSAIESELITIDPVERKAYQRLEYWPLVNARAHRLGKENQILNGLFHSQYTRFLKILSYRRALDDEDLMSLTCYLFRQGRVGKALDFFERVQPANLSTKIQYDYLQAYAGFYTGKLRVSRAVAEQHAEHPVERWRNLFANVLSQLEEIDGKKASIVDDDNLTQQQTSAADKEVALDFRIEGRTVEVDYQNLTSVNVNFYAMDIELLFSRNPFVQLEEGQFTYIVPNATMEVALDGDKKVHRFEIPQNYQKSNLLVELTGGGKRQSGTYFAHDLALQLTENYAQLRVTDRASQSPLPRTYVKVYARYRDGSTKFYKDGYTDLRGRFDYGALSTSDIDRVERFALLVMSDEHGALVREARAPKM